MGIPYSFLNVTASISGPGGSFPLSDQGIAEEGITIEPTEDKSTMTIGAGGEGMHSVHADNSGKVIVRLLKNSPANARLMRMYNYQMNPAYAGQNTISVAHPLWGEDHDCRECAFARKPTIVHSKVGPMQEWTLNCIEIDSQLGDGTLALPLAA